MQVKLNQLVAIVIIPDKNDRSALMNQTKGYAIDYLDIRVNE